MTTLRIEAARLGTYCAGILRGLGVPEDQAAIVADSLVEADLRGWLPIMGVSLTETQIERVLREAEDDLSHYVHASRSG